MTKLLIYKHYDLTKSQCYMKCLSNNSIFLPYPIKIDEEYEIKMSSICRELVCKARQIFDRNLGNHLGIDGSSGLVNIVRKNNCFP